MTSQWRVFQASVQLIILNIRDYIIDYFNGASHYVITSRFSGLATHPYHSPSLEGSPLDRLATRAESDLAIRTGRVPCNYVAT
jgi:hypothetical protein